MPAETTLLLLSLEAIVSALLPLSEHPPLPPTTAPPSLSSLVRTSLESTLDSPSPSPSLLPPLVTSTAAPLLFLLPQEQPQEQDALHPPSPSLIQTALRAQERSPSLVHGPPPLDPTLPLESRSSQPLIPLLPSLLASLPIATFSADPT